MNKKLKTILKVIFITLASLIVIAGLLYWAGSFLLMKFFTDINAHDPIAGLVTLPCETISQVDLGNPILSLPPAEFTTCGGAIYVKPRKYNSGGGFVSPGRNTTIIIGFAVKQPLFDKQNGEIIDKKNVVSKEITFKNDSYGQLDLTAGRYWLWTVGDGVDIVLYSCQQNGVSDPKPVQLPSGVSDSKPGL